MNANTIAKAWSDPVARLAMTDDERNAMPAHPAGLIARELSEEEMSTSIGGDCGCGWVCTYTGECGCSNGRTECSIWGCC